MAGVKDNAKVIVMENSANKEKDLGEIEDVRESIEEISRGSEAVALLRDENDKLADQVAALETVVCSGSQVVDKDIVYPTEMLMRQLLKLDGVDAEGEGRVQRKMEVIGVNMEKEGTWIPETPAKPIPARRGLHSVDMNNGPYNCEATLASGGRTEKDLGIDLNCNENLNEDMEKEGIWIPETPAMPGLHSLDTNSGPHNCEEALTSGGRIEKELGIDLNCNENSNEACISPGFFGCSEDSERSEVTEAGESGGSHDDYEAMLGMAGKVQVNSVEVPPTPQERHVQEETVKVPWSECENRKAQGVQNSKSSIGSAPTASETGKSRKRPNDGIDLNKKPKQRPRMKKHRPKILDLSKPKKVPKARIPRPSIAKTKTPKPETPNLVREKRKYTREKFPDSTNNAPKDVQDVQEAFRGLQSAIVSCRHSMDFDTQTLDRHSHHVPKSPEQYPSFVFALGEFDFFRKIVTSKRNTLRKNRYIKEKLESSEDLLEDANVGEGKIVHQYQRRKKSCSSQIDNIPLVKRDEKSELLVYRRTLKEKNRRLNSKRSGPSICKKRRKRGMARQYGMRRVKRVNEKFKQTTRKSSRKLNQESVHKEVQISKSGNTVIGSEFDMDKRFLHRIFPTKHQALAAKRDAESFKCVLSLSPLAESRKKRSKGLTCRRQNLMEVSLDKETDECLLPQEGNSYWSILPQKDNYSQIIWPQEDNFPRIGNFLPLQDVPVHDIESFTPENLNVLPKYNYFDIMNQPPLQEVHVLECQTYPQQYQDGSKGSNHYSYVREGEESSPVFSSLGRLPLRILRLQQTTGGGREELQRRDQGFPMLARGLSGHWRGSRPIREMGILDIIIPMFNRLHLNDNEERKELVLHGRNVNRALVLTNPPRKRKVIPKVALDPESERQWKLVMFPGECETAEETPESKECWEKEREIFRGRVGSFLAKTNKIQGDRRFTLWKGSTLDSITGVFLTQNVSDYLSSNAYMALRAQFPAKSRNIHVDNHCEVASSQESVGTYSGVNGHLLDMKEVEQDRRYLCTNISDQAPVTAPEKQAVSDASPLQHKPCVTERPNTFKERIDLEVDDYLRPFCSVEYDEASPNESTTDGDLSARKETNEEQSLKFFNMPLPHESCICMSHPNGGLSQPSQVFGNKEMKVVRKNIASNGCLQQKAIPEEKEPKPVDPLSTSRSKVTAEERVNIENNHQQRKEKTLNTETSPRKKKSKVDEKQQPKTDWEQFRKSYCKSGGRETNCNHMDSVDWEAVRQASVKEIAEIIAERGMHTKIALRIKEFLDRLVQDHGSLDLEWLRDVPPDKAKEFLLSVQGLGLKSVECVRLLALHHLAFPVDTNVARIAVRLGWVPLQPLPGDVQLHLLNAYPPMDAIQKYLFPRLCTLDQRTLYELHYQLITFGKIFCTKKNPNCKACPMKVECRHYASEFASARLLHPGEQKTSTVTSIVPIAADQNPTIHGTPPRSPLEAMDCTSYPAQDVEPIVECPLSPEPEQKQIPELKDIEDYFCKSGDDIPTIQLGTFEVFKENLMDVMHINNFSSQEVDVTQVAVDFNAQAASAHLRRMKHAEKLRTLHKVYELPDSHKLLAEFEKRDPDDQWPYLLAVWPPDECPKSSEHVGCGDNSRELIAYKEETFTGTILIPCRTANRGSFPLNGTYFQVNEVFADDETSQNPIDVPTCWLKSLTRRVLICGTSATSIFKGLSTTEVQAGCREGFLCVRGFNRKTREPRPLHHRFHISLAAIAKGKAANGAAKKQD